MKSSLFAAASLLVAFMPFAFAQAADPTVGVHALTQYSLGQNSNLTISTPALATQTSGSTLLVSIARGNLGAFTQVPTDNKGNTPYIQLGTAHPYSLWQTSGTGLYAFPLAAGGSGHVITTNTTSGDEITVDAVEIKNGGLIQDFKWNEVLKGNPLTSLSVTTTGPATLVAFWWGDGNVDFVHTAIPNNGFNVIDSFLPTGALIQSAVATKDVSAAGTYNVTWNSQNPDNNPAHNEGAQLWLVAVQSVPEPYAFTLPGFGAVGLFRRRR